VLIKGSDEDVADTVMSGLVVKLAEVRAKWPHTDWSGRVYGCDACRTMDVRVSPRAELPDERPCPSCGQTAHAWTDLAP
jgi:hypothetical protein